MTAEHATVIVRCPEIMVGAHPGQPDTLWTCAQRAGHDGPHNRYAPTDGCTAWADHCPWCAEHVCRCTPCRFCGEPTIRLHAICRSCAYVRPRLVADAQGVRTFRTLAWIALLGAVFWALVVLVVLAVTK